MLSQWLSKLKGAVTEQSFQLKRSVIVSGNGTYGLAEEIGKKFPGAEFCSRSQQGYDFKIYEDRLRFAQKSLDYDVYISCSCLSHFRQVLLLEQVYEAWKSSGKSGHIVCIGSSRDKQVGGTEWTYPIEKRALRDYCVNLSLITTRQTPKSAPIIKVTYISPGYFSTPKVDAKYPEAQKMSPSYLVSVIDWILSQPDDCTVSELAVAPLQMN